MKLGGGGDEGAHRVLVFPILVSSSEEITVRLASVYDKHSSSSGGLLFGFSSLGQRMQG